MEKQVTLVKTVDSTLDQVWTAWTEPNELVQWWGPDNVTIPECTVDLRVGGEFFIVMEAGEAMGPYKGTQWPMQANFTVVEPKTRLSYTAKAWTRDMEEDTMIDQSTEITFSEEAGKVKIEVTATIFKTGPKAGMAVQGMEMGFTQQLEKLQKYLTK